MSERAGGVVVGFSLWPAENGGWEPSMFDLFRNFTRQEMTFESEDAWLAFACSLERQGITLREVEVGV